MEAVFLHPGEVAFIVHLESDTSTRKPLKAKQETLGSVPGPVPFSSVKPTRMSRHIKKYYCISVARAVVCPDGDRSDLLAKSRRAFSLG